MIKNKLIGKIGCLLMLVWASVSLHAQSIELLGLYSNGSAGQLKAKVELAGKQIKSVASYAYRMSDGFATIASDYELIEGSFLTVDVEMQTGDYAYRMEVVLDDDTRLLTECVNQANTEAFMWLGDYQWTEATTAVAGTLPGVDRCFGTDQNLQTSDKTYYKGVSSKGGQIIYDLPEEMNFRKFDMVLGTQNGSGNLKFMFYCNEGKKLDFTVNSNAIKSISTADYQTFIPSLPLTKIRLDFTNNSNAIGNYNLARLYMERTPSDKQEQQVTFTNTGETIIYPRQVDLKATATSGGKIYYRIIKGRDAAELKGNVLTFKDAIGKGEFVAIVGKSGSGKSTLMNIIGALDVPTKGEYYLGGEDVSKMEDKQLARIRNKMIGFIFQQYNLLPKLNLLENVELPLLYAGVGSEERKQRAMASLEKVGLAEKWKNMPNQLSGGQQQRVSIARALAGDPSLILADEPTGALDSKTSREVLNFLKQLNEEGNTIVMITHDNSIAMEAKRVVRIADGHKIFDGDVKDYAAIL